MMKSIRLFLVLLIIGSLVIPVGKSEEQYNHVLSIEPPEPDTALWFGYEVDIVGDKIITSEPYATVKDLTQAGRIRVFDLEGNLLSTIESPDPDTSYYFGFHSSYDKDIIVASEDNWVGDVEWVGSVHVYSIDGSYLFHIQPDGEPVKYNLFGTQVQVSEDNIYITEKGNNVFPLVAGMVHVYSREGDYIRTIYPPNPLTQHLFGSIIKTHNDRVYISQYGNDNYETAGIVYVFDNQGTLIMTLESPVPENKAMFGASMSISGEYIVVGEKWASVDGKLRAGKAHIFNHEGEHLQTLIAPVAELSAQFGASVKVSGSTVVVGELNSNIGEEGDEGKVYVFNVDGELLQSLISPEPTYRGYFGWDVDIEGDLLAISEVWAMVDGMSNCGRIHVYNLGVPVETGESVEEGTTVVSETDSPSEPSGGIPGFPIWSIGVTLLLISIIISRSQKR